MQLKISTAEELPEAATRILSIAGSTRVFLFYGEMGAGKTTLIKALCKILNTQDTVSSPTFSIVNEYIYPEGVIYHFDFYRIKNETEAFDLGYEDYLYSGNFCFIEWPERIGNLLPQNFVKVELLQTSENERIIKAEVVS